MPVKFRRKLVKIGGSLRLTIPKEIADGLDWKPGDQITLEVTDSKVVLVKE